MVLFGIVTCIMNGEKIFVLDSSKTELKRPKREVEVITTEYEGQNIGVGLIDRRKISIETGKRVGKTIIWPMSYLARLDDFEKQRLATIAEELNARVIGVELPGVGMSDKAHMTFMQKLNMINPFGENFDRSAFAMLGAIKEVIGEDWGDSVDFVCYSQGAVLGASMVKQLSEHAHGLNVSVGKNTIIENGNDTNLNHRLLKIGGEDTSPEAKANNVKSDITDRSLNKNKKWSWFVGPADRADGYQAKRRIINLRDNKPKTDKYADVVAKSNGRIVDLRTSKDDYYAGVAAKSGGEIVDLRTVKPETKDDHQLELTSPSDKKHFDVINVERRTDGGKEKREALDKKQKIVLALGGLGLVLSSIRKNLIIAQKNGNLGDVNILKFVSSKVTSFEDNKKTAEIINKVTNRLKKIGHVSVTVVVAPTDKRHPINDVPRHPAAHSMADLIELLR